MQREHWPLLVIAAAGDAGLEPIHLQKSLFLIGRKAEQLGESAPYQFHPYDYGPFAVEVYRDAERLVDEGSLSITLDRQVRRYRITREGQQRADQLREGLRDDLAAYLDEVVRWAAPLGFRQIVQAIYRKFPEYRANSIFRG
ncbi:MAG: hypothetical protein R3F65_03200 [bacterium]